MSCPFFFEFDAELLELRIGNVFELGQLTGFDLPDSQARPVAHADHIVDAGGGDEELVLLMQPRLQGIGPLSVELAEDVVEQDCRSRMGSLE